MLIVITKR